MTWLTFLGLLSYQSFAAESPRIIDGSKVTFMYRMTPLGERGFELSPEEGFGAYDARKRKPFREQSSRPALRKGTSWRFAPARR